MSYGSYGVCAPAQTYKYQVPFIPDRKFKLGHLQCWLRHESQATDFTSGHCDDIAVWHAGGDGRSGSFASKALRHLCFNHLRITSYELRKLFPEVVSSLVFWSRLQIMMFFWYIIYIYIYHDKSSYALESGTYYSCQTCKHLYCRVCMVQSSFGCNWVTKPFGVT